jgi:nucleoside-diphosphate-sugar epimerase
MASRPNTPAHAIILGVNGAVGAYLARLLQARGAAIHAVANPADSTDGLGVLGIGDAINRVSAADAARLAADLSDATVFAINDGSAAQSALVADVLAHAAAAPRAPGIAHIVDHDVLRASPALLAQARSVAGYRRDDGRRAVNAILSPHDSRLGRPDSVPARIALAAFRAAQDDAPQGLEITDPGPRDWGWTAEYVDAIARLAALPRPVDLAIGSGHRLTASDIAAHAFGYFKRDPAGHVHIVPAMAPVADLPVDVDRLHAATGWRAVTHGRDLVQTLCEGAAARAA